MYTLQYVEKCLPFSAQVMRSGADFIDRMTLEHPGTFVVKDIILRPEYGMWNLKIYYEIRLT